MMAQGRQHGERLAPRNLIFFTQLAQ